MTTSLAVNSANDLYLGSDGNLALATGAQAVGQACEHAAKTRLGEMVLAADQGVPYFETIWQDSANVAQFEFYLRQALESVAGVVKVSSLTISVQNNVLSYVAEIQTIYGGATINV